jgi:hypothetical protein
MSAQNTSGRSMAASPATEDRWKVCSGELFRESMMCWAHCDDCGDKFLTSTCMLMD